MDKWDRVTYTYHHCNATHVYRKSCELYSQDCLLNCSDNSQEDNINREEYGNQQEHMPVLHCLIIGESINLIR